VTLGPYKFVEWRKDEFVSFERNDEWATPAAFPKLQLKLLQSDVAAAQLETGDLVASSSIAPLDAERLSALDSIDVSTAAGVYPEVLQFAVDNPALADPLVRQAMIYSLDLDVICEEVMLGFCEVHWNQVRLLAPDWAIPTDGLETYEYNPEKAKELLAEAGWDPDQKIILHNIGGADRVRATEALIIQASFKAVGIKTDIVSTDVGTMLDLARDPELRGGFYMFINRGAHFTADPNQVAPYTRCSTFYPNGANLSYYCDPELDALWDEGLTSTDPAVRGPIYHEAFQKISQNPDVVNLYWPETMITYNTALTGVGVSGMAEFFTWNIADWGWTG
jgi:peptide/nickel transport system substrate-binding protein